MYFLWFWILHSIAQSAVWECNRRRRRFGKALLNNEGRKCAHSIYGQSTSNEYDFIWYYNIMILLYLYDII